MGAVRNQVRKVLDGMEVRNAMREAARKLQYNIQKLCRERRSGGLARIENAREILRDLGIGWTEEIYYGVVMIHAGCSVTLAYTPDGALSWHSTCRRIHSDVPGDQFELPFADDDDLNLLGIPCTTL